MMRFSKLQATGNDFILVDTLTQALSLQGRGPGEGDWAQLARAMCDRHFGVGADGLMLVQKSTNADLKMRLFNADGSEAEVSGNGLRCFAKYAIEKGLIGEISWRGGRGSRSMTVETLSGVRRVKAYMSGNKVNRAEVNMGLPRFQPEQIPVTLNPTLSLQGRGLGEGEIRQSQPILDYPLVIDGEKLGLSILSMGNPHAVSFLSQPVADFPLAEIGPKVERHPMFPQRTNFEVARVLSRGEIEARVWERGVGETLACGSGACAIAVAAQLLGYVGRQVDIILDGGTLTVSWDGVGEVLLNGPVEEVFTGEWLKVGS